MKNDALQQLVRSLTSAEKRYFKVFASAFKESSTLTRLFDLLDQFDELSPALLRKEGFVNVNVYRSNLRKLIFKAMRNFHAESNIRSELRNMIGDAEFLMGKQLYNDAHKELLKAKKIADQIHDFRIKAEVILKINEVQRGFRNKDELVGTLTARIEDFKATSSDAMSEGTVRLIDQWWSRYVSLFDQNDESMKIDFFNSFIRPRLDELPSSGFTINLTRLGILSSFETAYGSFESGERFFKEAKALFDLSPMSKQAHFGHYFSLVYNHASALYQLDRNEESLALINELAEVRGILLLQNSIDYDADVRLRHGYAILSGQLRCLIDMERHEEALMLEQEFKYLQSSNSKAPNITTIALLHLRFGGVRFRLKDYAMAYEHVKSGLKLAKLKSLSLIYFSYLVAEALCFLKLGKQDLAEARFTNLYKQLLESPVRKQLTDGHLQFVRKIAIWNFQSNPDRAAAEKLANELESEAKWSFINGFTKPAAFIRSELTDISIDS